MFVHRHLLRAVFEPISVKINTNGRAQSSGRLRCDNLGQQRAVTALRGKGRDFVAVALQDHGFGDLPIEHRVSADILRRRRDQPIVADVGYDLPDLHGSIAVIVCHGPRC